MPSLRWAVLGLALFGLTALAQTPPSAPKTTPAVPEKAPAPSAARPTAPTVSPTAVAATVNGEAIYEMAVQRALERCQPSRRAEVRSTVITELVGNLLIDQSLRSAGYKIATTEVDKRINEMKAELKKVNREFDKMLADYHVTESELRAHITADLRWLQYANAQVTDKVLRELFDKNKDMFDGTAVQAWHILLSPSGNDEKAAAAVQAQLSQLKKTIESETEAGLAKLPANTEKLAKEKARGSLLSESFAKYAREKSECPSKARGGYVGWFRKAGYMTPTFAEAAFALQPYQISNPVKTPFGYHLIMVSERKAGKDVKFEEVKDEVKEVYLERLHESLVTQLRPRATIVVHPTPK
jgi:parvulin-like peptidyl-prolyl isomerase